jgi:hypothetical protein
MFVGSETWRSSHARVFVFIAITATAAAAQPAGQRTPPRMIQPGQQAPVVPPCAAWSWPPTRGRRFVARRCAPRPGAQETRTTLTDEQGRFELRELSADAHDHREQGRFHHAAVWPAPAE